MSTVFSIKNFWCKNYFFQRDKAEKKIAIDNRFSYVIINLSYIINIGG